MTLGEKLRLLRASAGYTQPEMAKKLGVSYRTYQNYELDAKFPKDTAVYGRISSLFNVTADYLLSDMDRQSYEAYLNRGNKSIKDARVLLTELGGLFAGGELSEEDKDTVMQTINDLYWKAKKNKRNDR